MSEQSVNSEILWWNPPIEEETSTVNLLLPQYYLVSSPSSLVNEMPGVVVTDYFIQSPAPFLGTIPTDLGNPRNLSPPTLSDDNNSNGVSDNQDNQQTRRGSRRRSSFDEEARIARRRERNRLAARRSRNRSRNYYNQLEQQVVELEAEILRLRDLLDRERE